MNWTTPARLAGSGASLPLPTAPEAGAPEVCGRGSVKLVRYGFPQLIEPVALHVVWGVTWVIPWPGPKALCEDLVQVIEHAEVGVTGGFDFVSW
jgi:hypothetical protein